VVLDWNARVCLGTKSASELVLSEVAEWYRAPAARDRSLDPSLRWDDAAVDTLITADT